jgi:hypothetical protein
MPGQWAILGLVRQGNRVAEPNTARLRPAVPPQHDRETPAQVPVDGPVEGWAEVPSDKPETSELTPPDPEIGTAEPAAAEAVEPAAADQPAAIQPAAAEPDKSETARPAMATRLRRPPSPRHLRVPPALSERLRRAGTLIAAWPHRPAGRVALPGLLILALVGLSVFLGGYVVPALPTSTHRAFAMLDNAPDSSVPEVPGSEVPGGDGTDPDGPGNLLPTGVPGQTTRTATKPADLAGWATPLAAKLNIPLPAMEAYGYAELATAAAQPGCQLRWTTLAGIGKVESNHGQDHATLSPDGKALPPIIGAPLDGQGGRAAIADSDQGQIDTDKTWDHAVGPMQFIPATWTKYAADANGDGLADINDINDAALTAARYLCASNHNLSTAGDWWAAILSYNALQAYAQDVFNAANEYGVRSR